MTLLRSNCSIPTYVCAVALAVSPAAFATDNVMPTQTVEVESEERASETDEPHRFHSRVRLERVVLFQDRQEKAELQRSLEESQDLLQRAIDGGAEQEILDRIQAEVDRRQAAVDDSQREIDRVKTLISELSEDQVFAYNRSLNNAISEKLVPYLDDELLKRGLGADLDRQEINALTQAVEQEARFAIKSERFRSKAEASGREHFLDKADRMDARGDAQRDKFLAKISDGSQPEVDLREEGRRHARVAALASARSEAQKRARESAREQARQASRAESAGKQAAKAAQREAVKLARTAAREEAHKQAKNNGKGKKD